MFDMINYLNTQEKLTKYKEYIKILEEFKKDVEELKICTQNKCSHDLIFCYKKMEAKVGIVKVGKCLICDKNFSLYNNNYYLDKGYNEKQINMNCIIDVTDKVSEYSQNIFKSSESVLVLKAKEKIAKMIDFAKKNNRELDLNTVKNVLSNTMIVYDEELKKERKRLVKEQNRK